jgi:hypothetical protein
VDTLPASLRSGPARLLAYRVQLLNAAGRTAGPSAAVFAASGPAPEAIGDLHAKATKAGLVLEWDREQGTGNREQGTGGAEAVEVDRVALEPPAAAVSERKGGLPVGAQESSESRFRAGSGGAVDAGGTIDRTAQLGHTYRYTAQRVRTVALGGQTLEVRSVPSAEVTVAVQDVFPPEAPTGLVAVPGFAGEGEAQKPAIDLSWEPNMEPRIAGYRVYRRNVEGDAAWQRLGAELVRVAAYHDVAVVAGKRYVYRVTAVDAAGHESGPSGEVEETAPAE